MAVRLFVTDGRTWTELTDDVRPTVRVSARDLQHAQRLRDGIRARDPRVSVILDVAVSVAADYRAARRQFGVGNPGTVSYVGTVAGLAGLIADIGRAGVADGVTLVPAVAGQDLHGLGADVLARLRPAGRLAS